MVGIPETVELLVTTEHDRNGKKDYLRAIEHISTLIGILTGSISIGLVILKGGGLVQKVDAHETRLSSIEARGSPPIAEHIKLDDEREARTRADIKDIKDAAMKMIELSAKVDVLSVKLDNLQDQLKRKPNL